MPLCEIIYVKHKDRERWKRASVAADHEAKAPRRPPALLRVRDAARASGYIPNQNVFEPPPPRSKTRKLPDRARTILVFGQLADRYPAIGRSG